MDNPIQIRQFLKFVPVAVRRALDAGAIEFRAQGTKYRGIGGEMIGTDSKCPGCGNETGCNNDLSFVTETSVGLFTIW